MPDLALLVNVVVSHPEAHPNARGIESVPGTGRVCRGIGQEAGLNVDGPLHPGGTDTDVGVGVRRVVKAERP